MTRQRELYDYLSLFLEVRVHAPVLTAVGRGKVGILLGVGGYDFGATSHIADLFNLLASESPGFDVICNTVHLKIRAGAATH